MRMWLRFLGDARGAVTVDWVALTAGLLLLGIMVSYSIYNNGVSGLVASINGTLAAVNPAGAGSTPSLNGGGTNGGSTNGGSTDGDSLGGGGGLFDQYTGQSIPLGSTVFTFGADQNGGYNLVMTSGANTFSANVTSDQNLSGMNLRGAVLSQPNQLTLRDGSTVTINPGLPPA